MDATPASNPTFSPSPQPPIQPTPLPATHNNPSFKFAILNSFLVFAILILAWLLNISVFAFAIGFISERQYEGNLPVFNPGASEVDLYFFTAAFFISVSSFLILKFPRFSKFFFVILGALFILSLPFTLLPILYISAFSGGFLVLFLILLVIISIVLLAFLRRRLQKISLSSMKWYYLLLFILCFGIWTQHNLAIVPMFYGFDFGEAAKNTEEKKIAKERFGSYELTYLPEGMKRTSDVTVRKDYHNERSIGYENEIGVVYSCRNSRYGNPFDIRGSVLDISYKFAQETVKVGEHVATGSSRVFTFDGETNINSKPAYYLGQYKDNLRLYFVFDDKYWVIFTDAYCLLPELRWGTADIVQDTALRERVIQELVKVASSLKRV